MVTQSCNPKSREKGIRTSFEENGRKMNSSMMIWSRHWEESLLFNNNSVLVIQHKCWKYLDNQIFKKKMNRFKWSVCKELKLKCMLSLSSIINICCGALLWISGYFYDIILSLYIYEEIKIPQIQVSFGKFYQYESKHLAPSRHFRNWEKNV